MSHAMNGSLGNSIVDQIGGRHEKAAVFSRKVARWARRQEAAKREIGQFSGHARTASAALCSSNEKSEKQEIALVTVGIGDMGSQVRSNAEDAIPGVELPRTFEA